MIAPQIHIVKLFMANTKPKSKTDFIHCRANPKIKEAAMNLAKHEGKSLSDLIADALKFYVQSRYASKGRVAD